METQAKPIPPPYFAFKTLTNLVVKMEEHGPPTRIDRTFLTEMSGAGQTQFIAGLKSLGLIDEHGVVQRGLIELVEQPDNRPALIGATIRDRYPEAVELGKGNTTTGELLEVFKTYGVQGDTARKAIAFYLAAAKYAGDVPLSPNFKTPSVRTGAGPLRKRRTSQAGAENGTSPERDSSAGLHPALAGLLADIPKRGKTWTQQEHDDFKVAFDALLKIAAPISDDPDGDDEDEPW